MHSCEVVGIEPSEDANCSNRAYSALPKTVQLVLFSATFPEKVITYAEKFAPAANQITLRHEELTVEGIKQLYMDCSSEEEKYKVLVKLYGLMTVGSSIIFVKVWSSFIFLSAVMLIVISAETPPSKSSVE